MFKKLKRRMLILSMEGGGIRGVLQAEFLRLLEAAAQKKASEIFDFFAGVSIGGMHALSLAIDRDYFSGKLSEFYSEENLNRIFPEDRLASLNPYGMWYPKYRHSEKTAILREIFQDYKLSHAQKPVMVSAYDYINARACYFSTYSKETATLEAYARDVADATSAAPTFFYPAFIELKNSYFLDGAIISNNPCASALIEAMKAGYAFKRIKILSLSTGEPSREFLAFGEESKEWGALAWLKDGGLIQKILYASTDSSKYKCQTLLGKNFMHIPFSDAPSSTIDDVSTKIITELKDAAKREFERIGNDVLKFIGAK